MAELKAGIKGKNETTVTEELCANAWGSGGLPVYATPAMIALMENTAWGSLPWDLRALAFFYTGQYEKAHIAISEALKYAPENKRLQENRAIIEHALGKTSLAAK